MALAALALSLVMGAAPAQAGTVSKNYSDIKNFLAQLVAQNPATTKLFTLGQSDSGEMIEGVQIGNGPIHNLLVGTHHGNEYGATEVSKAFAQDIAVNPIAGQTLFVIPVLNIGGYNARDRYETDSQGRSNDPNRDYPGPCGTEGPFHLKDTHALANFIDQQDIVVSSTLHTFGELVLYPWGISTQDTSTPYDDTFKQLGAWGAQDSKYEVGNSTDALYPADGAYEDYAFWKLGIWSMLYEIGTTHDPSDQQVAEWNAANVPGLRLMYANAPTTRAANHDFTGKCDTRLHKLDRHDE